MPAEGGTAVQITWHGGTVAFESPDGRFVYYSKARLAATSIWRVPVNSGEERQVLDSVWWLNFAVAQDGIFFRRSNAGGPSPIGFFSFRSSATTDIAAIDGNADVASSASPDSRYLLYSQTEQQGSELMLVENFR